MGKELDCKDSDKIPYWEAVARTRWGAYRTEVEQHAVLKADELSKKRSTAFEIGCEGGRWSKLLSDLGWNMTCTDIDEQSLDFCSKRIPAAECILVDPDDEGIPAESKSMGLLLCIGVPPVVQSDWFVPEAFRVLDNNGLMVCVFWNLLSIRGIYRHIKASLRGDFDYYKFSYPFWRRKLRERGFSIIHEEGFCWFPFHIDSNSSLVPFFTLLEKRIGLRKLAALSPWIVLIAKKHG